MESISELSPYGLTVLILNIVGKLIKESAIPSRFIPVSLLVAGGILFPFSSQLIVEGARKPLVYYVLFGIFLGGSAVGFHAAPTKLQRKKPKADGSLPPGAAAAGSSGGAK